MRPTRQKIVHKASHWSSHGKRRGRLALCIIRNKGSKPIAVMRPEPMFGTVEEMMQYYGRK